MRIVCKNKCDSCGREFVKNERIQYSRPAKVSGGPYSRPSFLGTRAGLFCLCMPCWDRILITKELNGNLFQ